MADPARDPCFWIWAKWRDHGARAGELEQLP
jgi:hypothetical protein